MDTRILSLPATGPVAQEVKPAPAAPPMPSLSISLIAVAVLCLAGLAPLLVAHMHQLWVRPHYQFFPLVLLGAGVLVWSRRAELQHIQPGSSTVTIGLSAFAWVLLAGAELVNSSWLAAVAALFLVLAIMQALGLARRLLVVWIYLWLIVPPPFGLDNTLIMSLQTLTTRWSSSLLDLARVPHVISGHTMEVGGQRLFVEEACAGVNSLFSILACALFYIFFVRVPIIRAIVLLLASLGWVLVANVARVFLVAYLPKSLGLAEGWPHDALGFALFAVALLLIWSTHRLLLFFTPFSKPDAGIPDEPIGAGEMTPWTTVLNQSNLNSWILGGAFGLLLVVHVPFYGLPTAFLSPSSADRVHTEKLSEATMPADLEGWKRDKWNEEKRSMSNAFGEHTKRWSYQGDSQIAVVSVDYPFPAWHELSECYYGQGWDLEPVSNHEGTGPGQPAHFCEQKMKKSGMRWGYLLYCQIDSKGQVLTPPQRGMVKSTLQRQQSILTWLLASDAEKSKVVQQVGSVYQFQVFVESSAKLSPDEERRMQARFFQAYNAVKGPLFDADGK